MTFIVLSLVSSFDSVIDMQTFVLDSLATIFIIIAVAMILASLSAIAWLCHSEAGRPQSKQVRVKRQRRVSDELNLEEPADMASV